MGASTNGIAGRAKSLERRELSGPTPGGTPKTLYRDAFQENKLGICSRT